MLNWFRKKKEPEKEPEAASPVIVEVPTSPVDCIQPFEHSALAKIRELQAEKDSINSELEDLNNTQLAPETPEFNKYVRHLANHMSYDFAMDRSTRYLMSYETSKWESYAAGLLEQSLIHCSHEVDFAKIACELNVINKRKDRIAQNEKRLKQIDAELSSLKKRLGVE